MATKSYACKQILLMEHNPIRQQKLIELCYFLVERHKAEQAYDRAQWKVSYYRKKLRANSGKTWKDPVKLSKKIEQVRLHALQEHKRLVEIKQRDSESMRKTQNSIFANFLYGENGRITGIWLPELKDRVTAGKEINMDKIFEIVDQHEADTTLTEALEDNRSYETDVF